MDENVKLNYELAFEDYKKGLKYKEIAEKVACPTKSFSYPLWQVYYPFIKINYKYF